MILLEFHITIVSFNLFIYISIYNKFIFIIIYVINRFGNEEPINNSPYEKRKE